MKDDVEALVRGWRDKVTGEQIVDSFADLVRVHAAFISLPQPLLADRIWKIQHMQLVGDVSAGYQRTRPRALVHRVCRKIEDDGQSLPQYVHDMRPHGSAKPCRQAREIFDRPVLGGKQDRHPLILADDQGRRPRRELVRER